MLSITHGNVLTIEVAFTVTATGEPVDPTTVVFTFVDPSNNETEYIYGTDAELVKDSVGNYHVEIDCDEVGVFSYEWASTGTGQANEGGRFRVKPEQIP